MTTEISKNLDFSSNESASRLYGHLNCNLQAIEKATGVRIKARGTSLIVTGLPHEVDIAAATLRQIYELIGTGYPIYPRDITYGIKILEQSPNVSLKEIFLDQVFITAKQKIISPKSINQKEYIEAIRNNDIVFGIGPAGTGKTYLAVAMAIGAYTSKRVDSIILARPAVEAGEKLGFLPGDMAEKINPYLRPLHDALNEMLGRERSADLIEEGVIEIAPLAFMRGRTLNNAFIILDEAQNTTQAQMKMFLTRIGFNSQAVVTGDTTQVDLPGTEASGLIIASGILKNIKGISFNYFTHADVVRHPLVQKIILAYEQKKKKG